MKINQDIIKETNSTWGFEYMTALCMEEFSEVIQAISKVRRYNDDESLDKLNEEIADCLICIEQLKDLNIINEDTIQEWIIYKQKRQVKRNQEKLINTGDE